MAYVEWGLPYKMEGGYPVEILSVQ